MCGLETKVILTFCYIVLLWSLGTRGLMYQPLFVEVLLELSIHVFIAIFRVKNSELSKKLVV